MKLIKELDYLNEADNQRRCKEALEPRQRERIYVPRVYEEHTTRRVLVTEWIEGAQLAKSPPEVINKLIPVGVECFLIQVISINIILVIILLLSSWRPASSTRTPTPATSWSPRTGGWLSSTLVR